MHGLLEVSLWELSPQTLELCREQGPHGANSPCVLTNTPRNRSRELAQGPRRENRRQQPLICFLNSFRIDRKKDKTERKILDSQERAFWDVHRPVVRKLCLVLQVLYF